MFFKTCSGNGRSEVKGPPGALYINKKEIIININIVGIATDNLFKVNLIIKKSTEEIRCFVFN
jgi:hypothetical protein